MHVLLPSPAVTACGHCGQAYDPNSGDLRRRLVAREITYSDVKYCRHCFKTGLRSKAKFDKHNAKCLEYCVKHDKGPAKFL